MTGRRQAAHPPDYPSQLSESDSSGPECAARRPETPPVQAWVPSCSEAPNQRQDRTAGATGPRRIDSGAVLAMAGP